MARFVFRMQNILSIKLQLEEQAKNEYGIEVRKLRDEEEKLQVLLKRLYAYQEELTRQVNGQESLDVRKIKYLEDCVEYAKVDIRIQQMRIRKQEAVAEKAREKLDEAMKERKTYEKLKEKAFEEFKKEVEAQERKEIDELVSFRFSSGLLGTEGIGG